MIPPYLTSCLLKDEERGEMRVYEWGHGGFGLIPNTHTRKSSKPPTLALIRTKWVYVWGHGGIQLKVCECELTHSWMSGITGHWTFTYVRAWVRAGTNFNGRACDHTCCAPGDIFLLSVRANKTHTRTLLTEFPHALTHTHAFGANECQCWGFEMVCMCVYQNSHSHTFNKNLQCPHTYARIPTLSSSFKRWRVECKNIISSGSSLETASRSKILDQESNWKRYLSFLLEKLQKVEEDLGVAKPSFLSWSHCY